MDNNDSLNNKVSNSEINKQVLEHVGYKKDSNNDYVKDEEKTIIYVKLINDLIVKVDKANFTAYRLNNETKEWQEDSVLYTEYEYGELGGEEIELNENYAYGSPYVFGGKTL